MALKFGTSPRLSKGFTLIELLISVAIMGTIVALVVPVFSNSASSQELDYYANNLCTKLNDFRTRAVSESFMISVRSVSQNTLECQWYRRPEYQDSEIYQSLNKYQSNDYSNWEPFSLSTLQFPGIENLKLGCEKIWFYPNGTATVCNIILNKSGKEFRINLNSRHGLSMLETNL